MGNSKSKRAAEARPRTRAATDDMHRTATGPMSSPPPVPKLGRTNSEPADPKRAARDRARSIASRGRRRIFNRSNQRREVGQIIKMMHENDKANAGLPRSSTVEDQTPDWAKAMKAGWAGELKAMTPRRRKKLIESSSRLPRSSVSRAKITEMAKAMSAAEGGVVVKNHAKGFWTYPNSFRASDAVTWIVQHGHAESKEKAVEWAQQMLNAK